MAEPLTIIGSLAAVYQITGNFVKVTKELRRCAHAAQSAPKEVDHFWKETHVFTSILSMFCGLTEEAKGYFDKASETKCAEAMVMIVDQCKLVQERIGHFVRSVKRIHAGHSSILNSLVARLLWVVRKEDTQETRLYMNSAKESITALTCFMTLRLMLQRDASPETIAMLKRQLREATRAAEEAKNELWVYRRRHEHRGLELAADDDLEMMIDHAGEIESLVTELVRQTITQHQEWRGNARSISSQHPRHVVPRPKPGGSPASQTTQNGPRTIEVVRAIETPAALDKAGHPKAQRTSASTRVAPQRLRPTREELSEARHLKHTVRSIPTTKRKPTFGKIIRDDGTQVFEREGYWHDSVYDSQNSLTQHPHPGRQAEIGSRNADADGAQEGEHPHNDTASDEAGNDIGEKGSESDHAMETSSVSFPAEVKAEKDASHQRQEPASEPSRSSQSEDRREEDMSSGPWRAIPPFGTRDGRRRPRKYQPPTSPT